VLGREISRAQRQGRPLSLILTDLDNFKEFNDRCGHLAGDEILVKVAGALQEACRRDMDLAFRYGGDEFMIILPEAGLQAARGVANRVRGLVAALGLDRLTLSVGLAELSGQQELTAFIRQADEAMYLAKQRGGDRAVVFAEKA
jgi:diguanylate cyclase (GGDEF)-like protein